MKAFLTHARERLSRVGLFEPVVIGALIVLVFLANGFIEVADDVLEGDTYGIDTQLLLMLRDGNDPANPLGPPWVEDVMRDLSSLGGIAILTLITFVAVFYLVMVDKKGQALFLFASIGFGTLASNLLKHGFDRPRPDLVPHGSYTALSSFPSGHSMMAALVYLTLGALLAQAQKDRRVKLFLMTIAIVIPLIVGVSRVYLGVHWPSDVLAGWLIGAMWALFFWTLERLWLRSREPG